MNMQKIVPYLWFDNQAEEAAKLYVSLFPNSSLGSVSRGPDGTVFMVTFQLDGQQFMALNGGPRFQFTEAVSFYVNCEDQAEVDHFWYKLMAERITHHLSLIMAAKHGRIARRIKRQHLIRFGSHTRLFHARRANGHTGDSDAFDRRPFRQ